MTKEQLERVIEAMRIMREEATEMDMQVLSIIDRILEDDYSGTGLYEKLQTVLDEHLAPTVEQLNGE